MEDPKLERDQVGWSRWEGVAVDRVEIGEKPNQVEGDEK